MSEDAITYKAYSTATLKKQIAEARIRNILTLHDGPVARVLVHQAELPETEDVMGVPVESRPWCASGTVYLEVEA